MAADIWMTRLMLMLVCVGPQHAAAAPVQTSIQPWPVPQACAACITFQFGMLEIRLPSAAVGKLFVPAGANGRLHLIPAGADIRRSLFFSATPASMLRERYHGLIPSAEMPRFFDHLGSRTSGPWAIARKAEHIDTADSYIKASNGPLHAYWIRATPPTTQYLHIAIDGEPLFYSISGTLTPELYAQLLSNLRLTPEP